MKKQSKYWEKEIKKLSDINNIRGQITMNELEELTYKKKLEKMCQEARKIKEAPFDDQIIQILFDKGGLDNVFSHLDKIDINNLSNGDKYRLGMKDYVDYLNCERNGKRRN